jgi:DNA-binding MarR family transcriptional regulator
MSTPTNLPVETEQSTLLANLTLQLEKFCQVKEYFFAHKFNLTPAEFRCLRLIRDNDLINTKELARLMKLTPGRITHLLNALERKNLIDRAIDKRDRRSIQVSLTEHSGEFIAKIISEYEKLHQGIINNLPADKRDEIMNNLNYFFIALRDWAGEKI